MPSAVRVDSISKPPGVKIIAKESQKPPYEDKAVAPKVLPTAISLRKVSTQLFQDSELGSDYLPHAGKQLDKATISIGNGDDQAW